MKKLKDNIFTVVKLCWIFYINVATDIFKSTLLTVFLIYPFLPNISFWYILLFIFLWLVYQALKIIPDIKYGFQITKDRDRFLRDCSGCTLQKVELIDIALVLKEKKIPYFMDMSLEDIHKQLLGISGRFINVDDYKRVFVLQNNVAKTAKLPAAMKTFLNPHGNYCDIFVTNHPNNMNNIELFQLLHEFGHTSFLRSVQSQMPSKLGIIESFIVLVLAFSLNTYVLLGIFGVILLDFILYELDKVKAKLAICLDEIQSDAWAINRANISWFEHIDEEEVAEKLCNYDHGYTIPVFSFWISNKILKEYAKLRKEVFAKYLKSIKQQLRVEEQYYYANDDLWFRYYVEIFALVGTLKVVLIIWLSLNFSSISLFDVTIFLVIALIWTILSILFKKTLTIYGGEEIESMLSASTIRK